MADPKTVLEFAKNNGARMLDLRFTDLPGLWHHISYPIEHWRSRPSKTASAWTLVDSRLGGDSRKRHAPDPRP